MAKSLVDRLRQEDLGAEREFLKRRRTAAQRDLDSTYDATFGLDTAEAIRQFIPIWRQKKPKARGKFPVAKVYEKIRKNFWERLDELEEHWRGEESDPDRKWEEHLTVLVTGGIRHSLRMIAAEHASGCLRRCC